MTTIINIIMWKLLKKQNIQHAFRRGHSIFNPIDNANSDKNRNSLAKNNYTNCPADRFYYVSFTFICMEISKFSILLKFECLSSSSFAITLAFSSDGKILAPNQELMWIFLCWKGKVCTLLCFSRENPSNNWSDSISFKNKIVISLVLFSAFKRSLFGIIQWSSTQIERRTCCPSNHESQLTERKRLFSYLISPVESLYLEYLPGNESQRLMRCSWTTISFSGIKK